MRNVTLRAIADYPTLDIMDVCTEQDNVRAVQPPDYALRMSLLYKLFDLRTAEDGEARFARQRQAAQAAVDRLLGKDV